ncbi:hypothetical protein D3C72_1440410 [compost metagenome]
MQRKPASFSHSATSFFWFFSIASMRALPCSLATSAVMILSLTLVTAEVTKMRLPGEAGNSSAKVLARKPLASKSRSLVELTATLL